jgi:hypothetical protein
VSCPRCDGAGVVFEYRLVWTLPRALQSPLQCCRRVDDAQEGWRLAGELDASAGDVDVLSGAKVCECRSQKPAASSQPDWKMRQAGDFEKEIVR